jgi:hypothetical protein
MNETVMQRPVTLGMGPSVGASNPQDKRTSDFQGYLLLTLLIALGWLIRDWELISPKDGIGYWLGIVGGSVMLVLLLYPVRKKFQLLRMLGPTKVWFRLHFILGLVGPLLILYHCNFQLGSFNSRVALYCMLLVAGSGIIGLHFYSRIHRGLYGRKTSLQELQQDLAASVNDSHGLAILMPGLIRKLGQLTNELQGDQITQSLDVRSSLRWTCTHHFIRLSLLLTARRELKAAAANSTIVAGNYKPLRRASSTYIREYTKLMGCVAQFTFYERLFALWHVFHLPIFYVMVLSALAHVLAVHMY